MRLSPKLLAGIIIVLVVIVLLRPLSSDDDNDVRAQLISTSPPATGFARATGPRPLTFPTDHGPHDEFQTEWWYYTGNLETAAGRHFGYQLTFFRRALAPVTQRQDRASAWATDHVYLAHFALTDVAGDRFQASERFSRGSAGLAGAQASPYRVWLEDWSVEETAPGVYHMQAAQEGLALDLTLTDEKDPILQGDRGYTRKGPEPGNASYYYSLTRLASSGTVRLGDAAYAVSGLSWMDHEYSTGGLGPQLVGWDWFSVQLDDGGEVMLYQLRQQDGSSDPFSSGTLIASDGRTTRLSRADFQIEVLDTWRSPHSGATYPARWTVIVPAADLVLEITPHRADQELNVSYTYWEGTVRVVGTRAGQAVSGHGYVELTGYAASMQNQF